MIKFCLIVVFNILFVFNIFAQNKEPVQFLAHELPRNYDVIKYELIANWVDILPSIKYEPEKRKWNAKLKITLTPLENNLSIIELDAVKLKINKIWIDNNELANMPNNASGILTIPVPTIHIGDTLSLLLDYTYINQYNIGFFHRNSLDNYPENILNGIDIPIAGTLSEPQDARYWLPCNDRPNDKALVSIACNVPQGMLVASNGRLDSTVIVYKNNAPYSEIFYWTSSHPMPPYLMTIAVSEYKLHTEKIPISSQAIDSVDVYYYTWKNDWEGNGSYNLSRFASNTSKTMQVFSDFFGNYPFEKYGIAAMDYTLLGRQSIGMEHQTLTTISPDWFANYVSIPAFPSFAHELAHSWFGNLVTCHTWKDIWFQEGGASWLEAIYLENINENKIDTFAYYNHMINHKMFYFDNKAECYELPLCLNESIDPFSNTALIYSKAAWIYHQLRILLGNDIFELLKKMLKQYEFKTITSQEFVDFFVSNVPNPPNGIDMKRFLEQFIFEAGHPVYNINSRVASANGKSEVHIMIEQIQDANNVPHEFLMNLNIQFLDENGKIIHNEFIINGKRKQEYSFQLNAVPSKIILDTTKALFEINSNILIDDIGSEDNFNNVLIYPNPVNTGQFIIQFNSNTIPVNKDLQVEMTDISGNALPVSVARVSVDMFNMNISGIAQGFYLLRINGKKIYKILVE